MVSNRQHIAPGSADHPASRRHAHAQGAPSTCSPLGVWRQPVRLALRLAPCLMSVAPGVRLSPCLFRQPCWLRHASPHQAEEGEPQEKACFFILSVLNLAAPARIGRVPAKVSWGLGSLTSWETEVAQEGDRW